MHAHLPICRPIACVQYSNEDPGRPGRAGLNARCAQVFRGSTFSLPAHARHGIGRWPAVVCARLAPRGAAYVLAYATFARRVFARAHGRRLLACACQVTSRQPTDLEEFTTRLRRPHNSQLSLLTKSTAPSGPNPAPPGYRGCGCTGRCCMATCAHSLHVRTRAAKNLTVPC